MRKWAYRLLAIVAVLGAALALWWIPDWGFLRSEITHFHGECSVKLRDAAGGCPALEDASASVFRVDVTRQEVVGVNYHELGAWKGCVVIDRSNWKCPSPDTYPPHEFGFSKGNFFERDRADGLPDRPPAILHSYVTIPKWRYMAIKFHLQDTGLRRYLRRHRRSA